MFKLDDVIKAIPSEVITAGSNKAFSAASIDSRNIKGGELFFAIEGENRDGHNFVENALEKGAAGAVISRDIALKPENSDLVIIKVWDTLDALHKLARAVRSGYNPAITAITGSAGKTTTKDMLSVILGQCFPSTQKSQKSYNNQYGVPLTILNLNEDCTHLVLEIGANHLGEIDGLSRIAEPDIGIITNIGYAHVGEFGSLKNTLSAKTEIVKNLRKGGTVIINGDDPLLHTMVHELKGNDNIKLVTAGMNSENDVRAVDIVYSGSGTKGRIVYENQTCPFEISLIGEHNTYAALLAVAGALANNIELVKACEALKNFSSQAGRFHMQELSGGLRLIDDSYNSNPNAVIAALKTLKLFGTPRRIAVLGEMKELGEYSRECHELVGKEAAASVTDLIVMGDGGRHIISSALKSGFPAERAVHTVSAGEAFEKVKEIIDNSMVKDIIVLVKGSRFTHTERVPLGLKGTRIKCRLGNCTKYIHCKDCPEL